MRVFVTFIVLCACLLAQTVSIVQFLLAFFPSKPPLEGYASAKSAPGPPPVSYEDSILSQAQDVSTALGYTPKYGRVVMMVVDALRSDFVFDMDSPFKHVRNYKAKGQAQGCIAKARMPTVTLPRLKALITGGIPGFVDLAFNLDSSELKMDNLLYQLDQAGKRLVHYGDDTWLNMFPRAFSRSEGTNSFFVADYTEVDNNVTRHIDTEMTATDWDVLILHYLGVDHIGHLVGPQSPLLPPKLGEMDRIIENITRACAAVDQAHPERLPTLFVILGDHGMTSAGNHGGNSDLEVSTALLFISPSDNTATNGDDATPPRKGAFSPETVDQTDIVPTIAALFGIPIPQESVGIGIQSVLSKHLTHKERLRFAQCNAFQMLRFLHESNAISGQKLSDLSEAYNGAVTLHAQYDTLVASGTDMADEESNESQGTLVSDREPAIFAKTLGLYEQVMGTLHEEALQAFTGYVEYDMVRSVVLLVLTLAVLLAAYVSHHTSYTSVIDDPADTENKQAQRRADSGNVRVVSGKRSIAVNLIDLKILARSALSSTVLGLVLVLLQRILSLLKAYEESHDQSGSFGRLMVFDYLSATYSWMDICWTWMTGFMICLLCCVILRMQTATRSRSLWPILAAWLRSTDSLLCVAVCIHALMMFSTSFVEEEHEIIYYILSTAHAYQAYAVLSELSKSHQPLQGHQMSLLVPPIALMLATRILRTYNQTGDKWRGGSDVRLWLEQDEQAVLYAALVAISVICVAGVICRANSLSGEAHSVTWKSISKAGTPQEINMTSRKEGYRGGVQVTNKTDAAETFSAPVLAKNLDSCWAIMCLCACICALVYQMKSSGLFSKLQSKKLSHEPRNAIGESVTSALVALVNTFCWLTGDSIVRIAQIGFFFIACACVLAAVRCFMRHRRVPSKSDRRKEGFVVAIVIDVLCMLLLMALLLHRAHNLPLIPVQLVQFWAVREWARGMVQLCTVLPKADKIAFEHRLNTVLVILVFWLGRGAFFQYGNSGKISTIDISGAYTGLSEYGGPVYTGTLTLFITYTGVLMWTLALIPILSTNDDKPLHRDFAFSERILRSAIITQCTQMTLMVTISTATLVLRHHLFAWSVMAPRYLYMFAETVLGALTTLLYTLCFFASRG